MRLHNEPLHLPHARPCELPLADGASLTLTLQPLPLGFHRRLHNHGIAPPQPPTRIARDSAGKPLRDQSGHALLLCDEHDADYRAHLNLYHQRLAVLMIAEALRDEPHLRFDTPAPTTSDWAPYADALFAELHAAGWSDGQLIHLCREIGRASRLLDDDLQETGRNFSSPPPPATS